MKKYSIYATSIFVLLLVFPFNNAQAQRPNHHPVNWHARHNHRAHWVKSHHYKYKHHVYFPQYHLFYDAHRRGYVYLRGSQWHFSRLLPRIFANINLGNATVRILANIPLNKRPEIYYPVRRDEDYYEDRDDDYEDFREHLEDSREDYLEHLRDYRKDYIEHRRDKEEDYLENKREAYKEYKEDRREAYEDYWEDRDDD